VVSVTDPYGRILGFLDRWSMLVSLTLFRFPPSEVPDRADAQFPSPIPAAPLVKSVDGLPDYPASHPRRQVLDSVHH
jgi:hypothetical protein